MPIRAGSGGLKYAPPNQSEIQARKAAASAAAGGAASGAAFAANRRLVAQTRQFRYDALQSQMDRDFRGEQAFYQREHEMGGQLEAQGFRAGLQDQNLQFQAESQLEAQGFREGESALDRAFRSDQARLDRDFTGEQEQRRSAQDQAKFDRGVDADIEDGIRNGTLELPDATKNELKKLDADRAKYKKGFTTAAEMDEFDRKYAAAQRKLLRTAQKPGGVSTTGQANQGITHFNPQTGKYVDQAIPGVTQPYQQGKSGLEPIVDPSKQLQQAEQQKQQQKRNDMVTKQFQENIKATDDEGKPRYADEAAAAAAAVKQVNALEKEMSGQQGSAAPGTPPAGVPPAQAGGQPAPQPNSAETKFNTEWATIKPGDSLIGPDGKVYTKKPSSPQDVMPDAETDKFNKEWAKALSDLVKR